MSQEKRGVTVTLPAAAIIIGVVLLIACLAAPLYAPERAVWVVRLLLGAFGILCVALGLLARWQDRARARLTDDEK